MWGETQTPGTGKQIFLLPDFGTDLIENPGVYFIGVIHRIQKGIQWMFVIVSSLEMEDRLFNLFR